jgi:hypothetical protein
MRSLMQRINTRHFVAMVTRNCVVTIITLTFTKHIYTMLKNMKITSICGAPIGELWSSQLSSLVSVPRGSNWSPKPLILYVHALWAICWLSCSPASNEIFNFIGQLHKSSPFSTCELCLFKNCVPHSTSPKKVIRVL